MTDKNYAAQAAMKCQEPLFVAFLLDASGVSIDQPDYANAALYKLCHISSKKQLNTEPAAAENWRRVLGWFDRWIAGEGKTHSGIQNPPFRMGEVAYKRGTNVAQNPFEVSPEYDNPRSLWLRGWMTAMGRENHKTEPTKEN